MSRKEVYLNGASLKEISTYTWSVDKSIGEECVCDQTGNLLCYYKHQRVENQKYKLTLISPEKSEFKWRIDAIEEDTCCMRIEDVLLTEKILEQVVKYICSTYSFIKFVIVDITDTDSETYLKEIEAIITRYRKQHNIYIQLDM